MVSAHNERVTKRKYSAPSISQLPAKSDEPMNQSEKELQKLCENYARQHGIPFFRQRMDRKSNMPVGTPDAFLCVQGAFTAVEFKVGTNGLSPEQSASLMAIQRAGGRIHVIRAFNDFVAVVKSQPKNSSPNTQSE